MYESIYEEEEYDPEDPPWPPNVDPTKVEINARIWLRDLEKRIRYFERFFGGGGRNIIADVKGPRNAAADLIVEAMEAKHKEVVTRTDIIMAKARGQAELAQVNAEELVLKAQQALSHTKATMALQLRTASNFKEDLEEAGKHMEELRKKGEEIAQKVHDASEQATELQLSSLKYASRNAVLTIQSDVAGLRTRITGLERKQLGNFREEPATRGRALERVNSPTGNSTGRPKEREQVSIEELIRGAQKRAISERRGTSPTRGCFTPSTSRQPSCDGLPCNPSQFSGFATTVTKGRVLSRTPSPS